MPPTTKNRISLNIDDILDTTDPDRLARILREKRGLRNVKPHLFSDSDSDGNQQQPQQRGSFPIEVQPKEKRRESSRRNDRESLAAVKSEPISISDSDEPLVVSDENRMPAENVMRKSARKSLAEQLEIVQPKSSKSSRIPRPSNQQPVPGDTNNLARRALHNAFDRVQGTNAQNRKMIISTPLQTRCGSGSIDNGFGSDISRIDASPSEEFPRNNNVQQATPLASQTKNDRVSNQQEKSKCLQGTRIQQESMEIDDTRATATRKSTIGRSVAATEYGDCVVDETNVNTLNNRRSVALAAAAHVNVPSQCIYNASRNSNVVFKSNHQPNVSQHVHQPVSNYTGTNMDLTGIQQLDNTQNLSRSTNQPQLANTSIQKVNDMVSTVINVLRQSRANSFLAPGTPTRSHSQKNSQAASFIVQPTQSPNFHNAIPPPSPSIAVIPIYPPQTCNQNHSVAHAAFTPVKATQQPLEHSRCTNDPLPSQQIMPTPPQPRAERDQSASKRNNDKHSMQPPARRPSTQSHRRPISSSSDEDVSPQKRRRRRTTRSNRKSTAIHNQNEKRQTAASNHLTEFQMTSDEAHNEVPPQEHTQINTEGNNTSYRRSQSNAVDLRVPARRSKAIPAETAQSEMVASKVVNEDIVQDESSHRRMSQSLERSSSADLLLEDVLKIDRALKRISDIQAAAAADDDQIKWNENSGGRMSSDSNSVEIVEPFDEDMIDESLPCGKGGDGGGGGGHVYDLSPRMGRLLINTMLANGKAKKPTTKVRKPISQNVLRKSQGATYNEFNTSSSKNKRSRKSKQNNQSRRKLYSKGCSEDEQSRSEDERSVTSSNHRKNSIPRTSLQTVYDNKSASHKYQSQPKYVRIKTIQNCQCDWFTSQPPPSSASDNSSEPAARRSEISKQPKVPPVQDENIFKVPDAPPVVHRSRVGGQRKTIRWSGGDRSQLAFRDKTNTQESLAIDSSDMLSVNDKTPPPPPPQSAGNTPPGTGIIKITRTRLPASSPPPSHDTEMLPAVPEVEAEMPQESGCQQPVDPEQDKPKKKKQNARKNKENLTVQSENDDASSLRRSSRRVKSSRPYWSFRTYEEIFESERFKEEMSSAKKMRSTTPSTRGRKPKSADSAKKETAMTSDSAKKEPPKTSDSAKKESVKTSDSAKKESAQTSDSAKKETTAKTSKRTKKINLDTAALQPVQEEPELPVHGESERPIDDCDDILPESVLSTDGGEEVKQRAEELFEALIEISMSQEGSDASKFKRPKPPSTKSKRSTRPASPTPSTSSASSAVSKTSKKSKSKSAREPSSPAPSTSSATSTISTCTADAKVRNVPRQSLQSPQPSTRSEVAGLGESAGSASSAAAENVSSAVSNQVLSDGDSGLSSNSSNRGGGSGQNVLLTWLRNMVEPRAAVPTNRLARIFRFNEVEISPVDDLVFSAMDGVEYAYYNSTIATADKYGYMRFYPGAVKRKQRAKAGMLRFLSLVGRLELTIEDRRNVPLNNGDLITVPKGKRYKIENKSQDVSVIFFMLLNA